MSSKKYIIAEIENKSLAKRFVKELLDWNKKLNKRQMPWKGEKDPYKIWLSEIILQQTRVEQGLHYYERFVCAYPTVEILANAPEQEIFKLWEGLGYYSRCKNLIVSAKYIYKELKGVFPQEYKAISSLKGVGSYTAAAIASFAYNKPHAVLDGNVFRVLSRVFDIETHVDTSEGTKLFSSLAQNILPSNKSGEYNQAIMDFGATICKPLPQCGICFFKTCCKAFLLDKQQLLPVKSKQVSIKERWFNYIILRHGDQYAISQRIKKDIWQNLFEFLLVETEKSTSFKKILATFQKKFGVSENQFQVDNNVFYSNQRLTHQIIHFQFIEAELPKIQPLPEGIIWVKALELNKYPFPKTLQQYIRSQF